MTRPENAAELPVMEALTAPLLPVLTTYSTQIEIISPDANAIRCAVVIRCA